MREKDRLTDRDRDTESQRLLRPLEYQMQWAFILSFCTEPEVIYRLSNAEVPE